MKSELRFRDRVGATALGLVTGPFLAIVILLFVRSTFGIKGYELGTALKYGASIGTALGLIAPRTTLAIGRYVFSISPI